MRFSYDWRARLDLDRNLFEAIEQLDPFSERLWQASQAVKWYHSKKMDSQDLRMLRKIIVPFTEREIIILRIVDSSIVFLALNN